MSRLSEPLAFPTCLSTIFCRLSYKYTKKLRTKDKLPKFLSLSSNKGQPSSFTKTAVPTLKTKAYLEVNLTTFCTEDQWVDSFFNQFLFKHAAEELLAPVRTLSSLMFSLLPLSSDQSKMNGNEGSLSRHAKLIGGCDRSLLCVKQLLHLGFPSIAQMLSLPSCLLMWCSFFCTTGDVADQFLSPHLFFQPANKPLQMCIKSKLCWHINMHKNGAMMSPRATE